MKNKFRDLICTAGIIWTAWFWTTTYVVNKSIDEINETAKQIILPNSNLPLRIHNLIVEIKNKSEHYSDKF